MQIYWSYFPEIKPEHWVVNAYQYSLYIWNHHFLLQVLVLKLRGPIYKMARDDTLYTEH